MTIDVSVIIASYNVASYIEAAVQSALSQQGVKLEVIIVDDCSTDATWDILSRMSDPRIRTRRNHENCGPSVTRNEAIAMANGKWIAILDGDDQLLPSRFARCLYRAKLNDAHIVVDNIKVRREADGKTFPMFKPITLARMETLDLATFINGNRLFAPGYSLGYMKPIFHADFLRQHNLTYNSVLRIGEDYLFLAEALANGALCTVEPSIGYEYTMRSTSISYRLTLEDIQRMEASDKIFLSHYALRGEAIKSQARRARSLRDAYRYTLMVDALKQKDVWRAVAIAARHPGAAYYLWQPIVGHATKLAKVQPSWRHLRPDKTDLR